MCAQDKKERRASCQVANHVLDKATVVPALATPSRLARPSHAGHTVSQPVTGCAPRGKRAKAAG